MTDNNVEKLTLVTGKMKEFITAGGKLRELTSFSPEDLALFFNQGKGLFMQKKYTDALEIFQFLSSMDHTNMFYHTALATTYNKLGMYRLAELISLASLAINTNYLPAYITGARALLYQKKYSEASEVLDLGMILANQFNDVEDLKKDIVALKQRALILQKNEKRVS